MLKKILNLFKKEDIIQKEVIKISEIDKLSNDMFKDYVDSTINSFLESFKEEIGTIKENIEEKCLKLENSELMNKNITLKEKQFMEGNRKSYVKHVRFFSENITLPESYDEIENSFSSFDEELKKFGKHTYRSKQILYNFFEHEVKNIINEISDLTKKFKQLNDLITNENYKNHLKLINLVKEYNNSNNAKKDISESIKSDKTIIRNTILDTNSKKKDLEKLTNSEEFSKYNNLKSKLKESEERLAKISSEIITKFSKIERAMRKYERIAIDDSKVISKYLQNPFTAISEDVKLEINLVFKNLKDKISSGKIELNNNDKIVTYLDEIINSNYLKKIHDEIISLNENIKKMKSEFLNMNITKKIEELEKKISIAKLTVKDYENKVLEKETKLKSINPDKFLEEIKITFSQIKKSDIELV